MISQSVQEASSARRMNAVPPAALLLVRLESYSVPHTPVVLEPAHSRRAQMWSSACCMLVVSGTVEGRKSMAVGCIVMLTAAESRTVSSALPNQRSNDDLKSD